MPPHFPPRSRAPTQAQHSHSLGAQLVQIVRTGVSHARCLPPTRARASTPSRAGQSRACSTGNGGSPLVRRPVGGGRARVPRRRRDRAAAAELLRQQLPQRRVHRAVRHLAARAAELRRRARHPPPLLPRLLRPGLRRVGDADGGERGRREPQRRGRHAVARRRGGHQQGQGRRRGAPRVRRQGLLRRHPRHGRARRRLPDRRAELRRGAGPAGRQVVQQVHREARPPGPRLRPQPAQRALRQQRPHPVRHDRALRRAHDRGDALRQVRASDLHVQAAAAVQPADEPRLPAVAAQGVPHELPAHGVRHVGRDHAQDLRQRLLRQPPVPEGPARLRPGALHRPPLPPHRQPLRRQLHRLLRRLRRGHGQARPDRGQDRLRRRGAPGLHRRQLASVCFCRVCVRVC